MTKKKTIEVFKNMNSPDYSDEEKTEAITKVMMQGMCDKVSKQDMKLAFKWLISYYLINGMLNL